MLMFLFACGSTVVHLEDYDQTCSQPEDCAVAFDGDTCGCGCDQGAINVSELDAYQQDRDDAMSNCGTREVLDCAPCPPVTATCDAGMCVVAPME